MKLNEVKVWVDGMIKLNHHKDDEVMVEISEPAIGPLPCVPVKHFVPGMDWDHGRTLIVPEVELMRKNDSRFAPMTMLHMMGDSGRFVWKCPRCMEKVDKYDSYCRHCGQNLQKGE